jgi:hypothetical protein
MSPADVAVPWPTVINYVLIEQFAVVDQRVLIGSLE